ncbi:MAG: sulfotransferase [Anaerolineae bacterium]|nr:sulfotransferase [Anaerolineae bacterium]
MSLITIIGRGHSGTRAMSHTLSASGVFMGEPLNVSGDLLPPGAMYDACRVFASYVNWHTTDDSLAGTWDWQDAQNMEIPQAFTILISEYLQSVDASTSENKGWKIPETTLVFPWIARLFPEAKYIYWVRDPRDSILGRHKTDDLRDFGIPYLATEDVLLRRAISWWYQYSLVKATPKPENWIEIRFEDFVLHQEETLARLENYLGFSLAKIPVDREAVGRWKQTATHDESGDFREFDFLAPAMQAFGYA